ncbi:16S rRNA (guanine(966)-N(2))-methyltransferase RsmD [Ramlibacter sp.]|uniref:16S rRNA (guanine(966)-N(2))-methyltransferase RsmD n=1 Tax=Ramlibacter sp. TaxID=1917967 RepID=UPI002BEF3881|nr:16S rRNA (guanine(966)-N(2))-methyltransferase RsmD [Ramlibacter sp.]HWI82564.1 16S rRNA (guanine(966)-N(2))-methyltransferase RsmD [Ramlibacter sp.]
MAASSKAGRPRPPRAARGPLPREVRIIGGQWKRTKLPVADKPGLRPTPDRVRETLFNWLDHDLGGWRCVDAFAGTGALGLEAASRGAAEVLLVEQDPELVAQLRAMQQKLAATAVSVERANGLSVLGRLAPGSVDLVFLDPPFDANVYEKALAGAAAAVRPEGLIYLEAPAEWQDAALAPHGLIRLRHVRAGAVHAHLLQRTA